MGLAGLNSQNEISWQELHHCSAIVQKLLGRLNMHVPKEMVTDPKSGDRESIRITYQAIMEFALINFQSEEKRKCVEEILEEEIRSAAKRVKVFARTKELGDCAGSRRDKLLTELAEMFESGDRNLGKNQTFLLRAARVYGRSQEIETLIRSINFF